MAVCATTKSSKPTLRMSNGLLKQSRSCLSGKNVTLKSRPNVWRDSSKDDWQMKLARREKRKSWRSKKLEKPNKKPKREHKRLNSLKDWSSILTKRKSTLQKTLFTSVLAI